MLKGVLAFNRPHFHNYNMSVMYVKENSACSFALDKNEFGILNVFSQHQNICFTQNKILKRASLILKYG